MIDVLIASFARDSHMLAVHTALSRLGARCEFLFMPSFPVRARHSIAIRPGMSSFHATDPDLTLSDTSASAVWWRRPNRPSRPNEHLDADDEGFVLATNIAHARGVWSYLRASPGLARARWINDPAAALRAQSKAFQLLLADRIGLKIPDTLIGNDVSSVRAFLTEYPAGVLVKSHLPCGWQQEGRRRWAFATVIKELDDDAAAAVAMQSAIYQQPIQAEYEIRTAIFGGEVHSLRIRKPARDDGVMDWRMEFPRGHSVEPYQLDASTTAMLKRFMAEAGLEFGCFDLIRECGGELVFLEVNEAGQFLWMEKQCPEIALLDAFCRFLIGATPQGLPHIRLDEVEKSAEFIALEASQRSIPWPSLYGRM